MIHMTSHNRKRSSNEVMEATVAFIAMHDASHVKREPYEDVIG